MYGSYNQNCVRESNKLNGIELIRYFLLQNLIKVVRCNLCLFLSFIIITYKKNYIG